MLFHDIEDHALVTDPTRRARQPLGPQDKGEHATGEFCLNREFSVATNLDGDEKKPYDLGRHGLVLEHRYTNT